MVEHRFGGNWTQVKLERLRKYLSAYTTIFHANERARFLKTVYVDAFAGTGYSAPATKPVASEAELDLFPDLAEQEAQEFLKGSAQIALDVEPTFDRYVFVEKEAEYAAELHRLKGLHRNSEQNIEIVQGDARTFLPHWCEEQDWKKTRAVVFLDPYSSQADWATIKAVAEGQVDLWILWPIGQVINRLLTTKSLPPPKWGDALTRAFGTDDWKNRFYAPPSQLGLFGEHRSDDVIKIADFKEIERFFVERLETIFEKEGVARNPLYLYNSQNTPLYLLCFAAHNKTAVKIAQDILRP
ncbi:MAG: three-Cys-motif partner protein TcmP [Armatimonadetes bacterium]|nr:three-Cys-motif partner protein TcmP [Armatimonadota bacterium]